MEYNFGKLWSEQFFGFFRFKSFFEYVSDEESQINHYKRLGMTHVDDNGIFEVETSQLYIDDRMKENKLVLEMIKNQLITFLFTRYEFIVKDTIKCLLCNDPDRILKVMKKYPDYYNFIGFSLEGFLKSNSKEDYIIEIGERLSSRMLSGKPSKAIKRLREILNFGAINTSLLDDLMDKRNRIVHENYVYELEIDELEVYYNTIDNLLKVLSLGLKSENIDVIDPGRLLIEETCS